MLTQPGFSARLAVCTPKALRNWRHISTILVRDAALHTHNTNKSTLQNKCSPKIQSYWAALNTDERNTFRDKIDQYTRRLSELQGNYGESSRTIRSQSSTARLQFNGQHTQLNQWTSNAESAVVNDPGQRAKSTSCAGKNLFVVVHAFRIATFAFICVRQDWSIRVCNCCLPVHLLPTRIQNIKCTIAIRALFMMWSFLHIPKHTTKPTLFLPPFCPGYNTPAFPRFHTHSYTYQCNDTIVRNQSCPWHHCNKFI